MTHNNKIVWSEGLFLRPQHMQQHERYLERYIELRAAALRLHASHYDQNKTESPKDIDDARIFEGETQQPEQGHQQAGQQHQHRHVGERLARRGA